MVSRRFEKERLEIGPWDLLEEEGQLRAFGEGTSKEENNVKTRKGPVTNVADTTLVLVPKAANGGN